jgi:ubiquinone/menaquinone biosynthesis C-methylase UbiE
MADHTNPGYLRATGRLPLTAFYDRIVALTMREPVFRSAVVDTVAARAPDRIVDIGCGTGTLAIQLARAAPQASVIGIDPDQSILKRAREKARKASAHVELLHGRAEQLPLEDGSADCVTTTLMLHHLAPDHKRRALGEMFRVLSSGGLLVVADWGSPQDLAAAVGFRALRLVDGRENTREHAAGELPQIIGAGGFDDVRVTTRVRTLWGTLEILTASRPPIAATHEEQK